MTPQEFALKWRKAALKESAAYVSHFEDVCRVLGHPAPSEADPKGQFFTYQRASRKDTGRAGFADVWFKDRFGWEYRSGRSPGFPLPAGCPLSGRG